MIPNRMIPGETLISAPDNEHLVLTTHRIRSLKMSLFRKDFESIFLEDIASIAVKVRVNGILFTLLVLIGSLFALAFIFGGFVHRQDEMLWMGIAILGGSVVLAYFIALKYTICVASKGGDAILLPARMVSIPQIFTFIESVEIAKAARIKSLSANP